MAEKKVVFDPLQHLELFDNINSYIDDDSSRDLLYTDFGKCYTEADIRALWNHFHSPGIKVDGLVDSYEEFRDIMLSQS